MATNYKYRDQTCWNSYSVNDVRISNTNSRQIVVRFQPQNSIALCWTKANVLFTISSVQNTHTHTEHTSFWWIQRKFTDIVYTTFLDIMIVNKVRIRHRSYYRGLETDARLRFVYVSGSTVFELRTNLTCNRRDLRHRWCVNGKNDRLRHTKTRVAIYKHTCLVNRQDGFKYIYIYYNLEWVHRDQHNILVTKNVKHTCVCDICLKWYIAG